MRDALTIHVTGDVADVLRLALRPASLHHLGFACAGRGRWSDRAILTTPLNSGRFADC